MCGVCLKIGGREIKTTDKNWKIGEMKALRTVRQEQF